MSMIRPPRRRIVAGLSTAAAAAATGVLSGCASWTSAMGRPPSVAGLFAGRIDDRGFMEAGWRGLERARVELGARTTHLDGVAPRREALADALARLAGPGPDLVVAHGGQTSEAVVEAAARFPRVRFVVTQGAVVGPNLASYEVMQEESAYLAGVLAALVTRTGVVGHMSGLRVRPGLKGRAAYAAGVRATDPAVRLLTNFSGQQDDVALSRRVAEAQIAAGADVIFTMLNAGRDGVTQACRAAGRRQIGNVIDWTRIDPRVFVASAIADVSLAVFEPVRDLRAGRFPAGAVRRIGLSDLDAVRLAIAPDVPATVRERVDAATREIVDGRTTLPDTYEGPEFTTPG